MCHHGDEHVKMTSMSALAHMDSHLPDSLSDDLDSRIAAKLERQRLGLGDPVRNDLPHTVLSSDEMRAWSERSHIEQAV